MATSQKVTAEFLTCTVCMEFFKDPCTLDCQHTFCRECLTNFTVTQPEAIYASSLPCPVCRSLTKVLDPDKPVEKWADQKKPSFTIQKLIDSFGPGAKDTTNCKTCKDKEQLTPATAWCSLCDESFCEHCGDTHIHTLSDNHANQFQPSSTVRPGTLVMCTEHPTLCIEYLCKDCSMSVCHKCCIRDHRKCLSVIPCDTDLSSITITLTNRREDLLKKISKMRNIMEQRKLKMKELEEEFLDNKKEIIAESQKARDQINIKETMLLERLRSKTDEQTMDLTADINHKLMAIQKYQQQSELIDQAVKSGNQMNIYEMHQSCQAWVETDTDLEQNRNLSVKFRKDTEKLLQTLNDLQLGEVEVSTGEVKLDAAPVQRETIDIRVQNERNESWPTDVTVVDVDGVVAVVVTDRNNRSVKSFYRRNNQSCHHKLILSSDPWSLTRLKQNQVAVSVPDTRQIVIVEVNPDLKILSKITTNKIYRGIVVLQSATIAAASRSYGCVDILNENGTVLKSVSLQSLSIYPDFLCRTRTGNILVSDCGTKSVLCLTQQGDVVFNYCPTGDRALRFPMGIITTNTGDILIADTPTHNVVHLTESGRFVKNLLTSRDGLTSPRGLYVDTRGRLLVCHERCVTAFQCGC